MSKEFNNKKAKPYIYLSIWLLVFFVIVGAIIINLVQKRNGEINALNNRVSKNITLRDSLSRIVLAEQNFIKNTGGISMPIGLMDTSNEEYTTPQTAVWEKCYAEMQGMDETLTSLREGEALLSGADSQLYNSWITNAEKINEWSVCYKDSLYSNASKTGDADTEMKNISDRINGRVKVVDNDIKTDMSLLQDLKNTKYLLFF